jgi:hypothetical protein
MPFGMWSAFHFISAYLNPCEIFSSMILENLLNT